MSEKEVKLHTTDKTLLGAVTSGSEEGMVELTPDLFEEIMNELDERIKSINETFPELVKSCPEEVRLAVTAQVFRAIIDHAMDGGSFRYLIYNRLGFNESAYVPLYEAGGMTISNEFDLSVADMKGQGWLSIDTAPKDGTHVDLWITPPKGALTGGDYSRITDCWFSDERWWATCTDEAGGYNREEIHNASHWMKVPAGPE